MDQERCIINWFFWLCCKANVEIDACIMACVNGIFNGSQPWPEGRAVSTVYSRGPESPRKVEIPPAGIKNLGNTCYMNEAWLCKNAADLNGRSVCLKMLEKWRLGNLCPLGFPTAHPKNCPSISGSGCLLQHLSMLFSWVRAWLHRCHIGNPIMSSLGWQLQFHLELSLRFWHNVQCNLEGVVRSLVKQMDQMGAKN